MGNLLYTIAVILVIVWAIGFFGGFVSSGIIHVLLVIAVIAVLLRFIRGAAWPFGDRQRWIRQSSRRIGI